MSWLNLSLPLLVLNGHNGQADNIQNTVDVLGFNRNCFNCRGYQPEMYFRTQHQ